MTATTEYSQDFFIYVPGAKDVEILSQEVSTREKELSSLSEPVGVDLADDNWVKIPLGGNVVVYARLWGDKMLIRSATNA